nr:hypothetical protein [Tanacetum cinerariifolium]
MRFAVDPTTLNIAWKIPSKLLLITYPRVLTKQDDALLSKFKAEFKQQQSEMANKIDTFLKAINDRMTKALLSNTVKNPKLNVDSTSSILSASSYLMKDAQSFSNPFNSDNDIKTNRDKRRGVEVYVEKLKLLEDFYVTDMEKDPACPLLFGRGFLTTASAVIGCKKSKISVGEGITSTNEIGARTPYYLEKDFVDNHVPRKWEIAIDAELNPFKDVLVFRKMVEFPGAIRINFKGNIWESEDMMDKKIDKKKPPKEGDGAWHIRIELIDPDAEKFDRVFQ